MSKIHFDFKVVELAKQDHVKFAKEKGYVRDKKPSLYVLGGGVGYVHYELYISYYYQQDIDQGCTIEEALCEVDPVGFWAKTENPLEELLRRVLNFYDNQSKVLEYRKTQNDYSCSLEVLPTNTGDRFLEDHLISWVESVDKSLLTIPVDYKEGKLHIEDLEHKYRKMVELFNKMLFDNNFESELLEAYESLILN